MFKNNNIMIMTLYAGMIMSAVYNNNAASIMVVDTLTVDI